MTSASFSPLWAVGLMSGTSLDGIDAALIETDGETVTAFGPSLTVPYDPVFRERLRAILGERGGEAAIAAVERELTDLHARAVQGLAHRSGMETRDIGLVGFHGQTIAHRPDQRRTRQIGDGPRLARMLSCPVAFDFRSADVAAGGQGAPLVPVYHRALAARVSSVPMAVLNVGGVANVTFLTGGEDDPLAFDTGPGNALLDDWALRHTGRAVDLDGALARAGRVDEARLARMMAQPYFVRTPPKSLDRDDFAAVAAELDGLSAEDGAATLAAFTVEAVAVAWQWAPNPPQRCLVCGGGRKNPVLMERLAVRLGLPVSPVEVVGWDGDALEAQAFAFLAVRTRRGLPQTYPGTTGVPAPMTGGRVAYP